MNLLKNENLDEEAQTQQLMSRQNMIRSESIRYLKIVKNLLFKSDNAQLKNIIYRHLEDYELIARTAKLNNDAAMLLKARQAAEKLLHLHMPETVISILNYSDSTTDMTNVPDEVLKEYINSAEKAKNYIEKE